MGITETNLISKSLGKGPRVKEKDNDIFKDLKLPNLLLSMKEQGRKSGDPCRPGSTQ